MDEIKSIQDAINEIEEYIQYADKAISDDEEYIRGWKSAMYVALEVLMQLRTIAEFNDGLGLVTAEEFRKKVLKALNDYEKEHIDIVEEYEKDEVICDLYEIIRAIKMS